MNDEFILQSKARRLLICRISSNKTLINGWSTEPSYLVIYCCEIDNGSYTP